MISEILDIIRSNMVGYCISDDRLESLPLLTLLNIANGIATNHSLESEAKRVVDQCYSDAISNGLCGIVAYGEHNDCIVPPVLPYGKF